MSDILFVDIPYYEESNVKEELDARVERYRRECTYIVNYITGKEYVEKEMYYSIGILCLSNYLKMYIKGIDIQYVHYYFNFDFFEDYVRSANVVAFSTMTFTMPVIMTLVKRASELNPKAKIVLGGYHATFFAEEICREYPIIDCVFLKEGEESLKKYMQGTDKKLIDGIVYRNENGDVVINPFNKYLDEPCIPSPDYDLVRDYISYLNIQLSTMRGCIGKCNFCVNSHYWGKPRLVSIANIISELKYLKARLPKGSIIHITDNIFTFSTEHLQVLIDEMVKNSLDGYFNFECDTLCRYVNQKNVEMLRRLGVIKICLGIEDCNEGILKKANKPAHFSENLKAAVIIKKTAPDICIFAYWIIGLPGSTKETIEENLAAMSYTIENKYIDVISPKVFIPYPGSTFFEEPRNYGLLDIQYSWDMYERRNPPFPYKYDGLSGTDLYTYLLKAFDVCHIAYKKRFGGN